MAACLAALVLACPRAAFAGSVTLVWDPSADPVAGYKVFYGTASNTYTNEIDVGNRTSATVSGLTNGVRYYFIVRAYSPSGVLSAASNEVSGVVTPQPFVDDPLLPGVHTVKAAHISELRSRIDGLRAARGQPPFSWAPVTPGALIQASHITHMRTALRDEFVARGKTPPAYLAVPMGIGASIKAADLTQLREAVIALE